MKKQQQVLGKHWNCSRWQTPQLWTFSWDNLWSVLAQSAKMSSANLDPPSPVLRTLFQPPRATSPCSGSATAVLVSPIFPHLLLPNFIACRTGGCWRTSLCPMSEDLASSGTPSSLDAQLWGTCWFIMFWKDSVTEKVNNRVDHHVQPVINNNSVQKWKVVLNAGFLLGLIFFNVFTNNLVNVIKGVIIKNLLGLT